MLVALGTSFSSFWILVNNSWMQAPTGFEMTREGVFAPNDWFEIIFNKVVWVRFPHMILAAYVTAAFGYSWHQIATLRFSPISGRVPVTAAAAIFT